jgi:hypothetical protein
LNVTVIPDRYKRQKPTGDTVTGKPVTNPAVVALDTSIVVAHSRRIAKIPSVTKERSIATLEEDSLLTAHPFLPYVPHLRASDLTTDDVSLCFFHLVTVNK